MTQYFPIAGWLRNYPRDWLRCDIVAGLTTAAVVIPKAMAMATVAGLPVELGLYTALMPMAIYAILGTSPTLSVSTTATIAILTGAALQDVVQQGPPEQALAASATLTLMVGAVLMVASVLRLGHLANFISDPVLTGFKLGLGFVIALDQAPKLLGIHFPKAGFGRDLVSLFRHLPQTSMATLAVGAMTLIAVFAFDKFWPRVPGSLLAVAGGIGASWLLMLDERGVAVVGQMPSGLPAFHLPVPLLIDQLWPAAIGIALMSFTETVAAGRAFARPGNPRPDPDQELRALGMANLGGSFLRAISAGGGTSQTAVNYRAGARTQAAEFTTVGVTVLAVLFLAPLIQLMPQATLAAVVIATAVGLLSPTELITIWHFRHMEFWWGVAAALGVIFLGTLHGILVAVVISLAALVYETNRAPVYVLVRKLGTNIFRPKGAEHADDESFPGLLLLRTEGRMYFANAQRVGDRMWQLIHNTQPRVVVIDCSAIPDIEYTALKMLTNAEEKLRDSGIALWLAGLTPVALDVIRRSPLGEVLGRERMCFDVAQAVSRYQSRMRCSA
jgi:SulP family sulfate permease